MVVDSFLLVPSLLLLVAGLFLLTPLWRRQGSDRRRQWWTWWLQVVASKSGAERQTGRHRSPLCRPRCSQQQASQWQGSPILPHPVQPGKIWPLVLRSLWPSLHMDSATGTSSSAGKPGRLPRQDQRPQVLVARGTPRTLSQRPRLGGGVKDLPPEISNFTKPPVKGLVFQEGLVQTEERKRWWHYQTKRLFWHRLSPALPKGKSGTSGRVYRSQKERLATWTALSTAQEWMRRQLRDCGWELRGRLAWVTLLWCRLLQTTGSELRSQRGLLQAADISLAITGPGYRGGF
ncbi:uncharacterized protein LOC116216177 [Meleagris gallopavo]|uniref:uncharacterized protein LOC116216177 n=1 Tax=Meleagris gallopavo TaxID=9103 RepID=UPI0012AC3BEA|nr:uncharacterized protein LOC116216177 [Meleagris gallopavo]